MTGYDFFDTTIFLHAKFDDGSKKHDIARNLIQDGIYQDSIAASIQVIDEFSVNALKNGVSPADVGAAVETMTRSFHVLPLTRETVYESLRLMNRYKLSFWNSMIVSAACRAQCRVLYTEDIPDGLVIDRALTVRNPFIKNPYQ
ncbi:MAG: PIN domain-containing protein [Synergistaceae bacterium]|jgi:predicted nucleic acid-binding protein|nr:PIN domain-containing protein [Synergistaceae bacterium]